MNFDNSLSGTLFCSTSSTSTNNIATEQILNSFILPANSLCANGQRIKIRAWGFFANNSHNKAATVYFGNYSASTGITNFVNESWFIEIEIIRNRSQSESIISNIPISVNGGGPFSSLNTIDLTQSQLIKVTGTNGSASANDITCDGFIVEGFLNS